MGCRAARDNESPLVSTCDICDAVIDANGVIDGGFPVAEDPGPISETEKCLEVLGDAVKLYEEANQAAMASAKAENLKTTAELTGVQPSIILYASRLGVLRAHNCFLNKKEERHGTPERHAPERQMRVSPATPQPPSPLGEVNWRSEGDLNK